MLNDPLPRWCPPSFAVRLTPRSAGLDPVGDLVPAWALVLPFPLRLRPRTVYPPVLLLSLAFFLSGISGLVYETMWSRYLGLFVGHTAYAQASVLILFLGGVALGALWVAKRAEVIRRPLVVYAAVELAVGVGGILFHDL